MPQSIAPLIGDIPTSDLQQHAKHTGFGLRTGPFSLRLTSDDPQVVNQIQHFYRFSPAIDSEGTFIQFNINLQRPRGPRRWWRPQIAMRTDALTPFEPFPLDHAFPLFEWAFNWCIASQAHQFWMLHAAVIEKEGVALIMPALPGSGKSTLCAALMLRGWRLLSDEFGLIRPDDPELLLHPLPRPIPLKNASIEVIRGFASDADLGPTFPKTRKGDVAHLVASEESQRRGEDTAPPGWFLFPRFAAGSSTEIAPLERGWTFLKVSGNSFNYKLQGARGFRAAVNLVNRCPAHSIQYSDLDDAVSRINDLHAEIVETRKN